MKRSAMAAAVSLAYLLTTPESYAQDGKRRALVIGLDASYSNVEGVGKLEYAEIDANAVAAELVKLGWEKPIPLIGAAAPRSAIINALLRLARDSAPEDTVLIYFAGHGVSLKWAKDGKKPHTYWIMSDTTLGLLDVDGLRLEHLIDYVGDIPAKKKVVILDHCHSGTVELPAGTAGGGGRDGGGKLNLNRDFSLPEDLENQMMERAEEGLLVIGAASDAAYEVPKLGHGLFTKVLLEALSSNAADIPPAGNGDGKLSTIELAQYLERQVAPLAAANNVKQKPIVVWGGNLRTFDITVLPQTPDKDEATLLATIGRLAASGLDSATEQVCTVAVQAWAEARRRKVEPNQKDLEIVKRLQTLQNQGPGVDWRSEASKMPGFISFGPR